MFNRTLHMELWLWLSENPDSEKRQWPRWDRNGGDVEDVDNRCFACEATADNNDGDKICGKCPIEWPGGSCCYEGSPFDQFRNSTDPSERSRLAKEIAMLPVKEGVEYI